MTTIVHDTSEAVCLSADYNLYLKPIVKMTISVALPQLKLPGKSISNWEVMERVKAMVAPEQFSALRIDPALGCQLFVPIKPKINFFLNTSNN